jgi:NEDD8-activating enzyme E1 regulatory subunit
MLLRAVVVGLFLFAGVRKLRESVSDVPRVYGKFHDSYHHASLLNVHQLPSSNEYLKPLAAHVAIREPTLPSITQNSAVSLDDRIMDNETAPRELTPPPLQAPSAKEKKYDRQLRLWAASGQRALEESHVLLVVGNSSVGSNSNVAGVETLKNLILPSIGNFTIADEATVKDEDLGINFFLEPESLGKSRAEETTRLLQELNPDVTGHAIWRPLAEWLPEPDSLKPYNLLILCAPLPQEELGRLSAYALTAGIPLIHVQSVGFYSSFSVQLPTEFPIVDTHPDPDSTQDLRLLRPWPELVQAVEKLGDLSAMSDHDHGHIPYLLILLHSLQQWAHTHDGTMPSTFAEKTAFRTFVQSQARTNNPEGSEENFDEAASAVLKSIAEPPVSQSCKDMFKLAASKTLGPDTPNFWVIATAVSRFYAKHGLLPLPGSVPDMKATSEAYVALQSIYKSKARRDVAEVVAIVRELERDLARREAIEIAEIEAFCKNAAHVRVLTNETGEAVPSLRYLQADPKALAALKTALEGDWEDMLPVFVGLNHDLLNSDSETLSEDGEKKEVLEKCIAEIKRAGGGELHNISSLTGGMVAQEAIKLLTRQYVPVEGTCVFDGIRVKAGVFRL